MKEAMKNIVYEFTNTYIIKMSVGQVKPSR